MKDYYAALRAARCRAGDHSLCSPSSPRHGICVRCGSAIRIGGRSGPPERRVCHPCRRIEPATKQEPIASVCPVCGQGFTRGSANIHQQTCSRRCGGMVAAWKKLRPGLPFDREEMAAICAARKIRHVEQARARRLRHAQTWDGITDEEILDRDGWRCQIAGCKRRPIRRDLKRPHPRSPSIDHIIPLSLGGDDTAVNKRAAHLGCNVARGNQMGAEQVALFGVIREPPLVTRTATGATVGPPRLPRPPQLCECGTVAVKGRNLCRDCMERDCPHCGQRFTVKHGLAKYCSPECAITYRNRRRFPSVRYCGCGQRLLPGRHKCDACKKSKAA